MGSTVRTYLLVVILMLACISLHGQITSTFNSNAEGWTTPNDADATITYAAAGGNPGGLVSGSPFVLVLGATTLYVPFDFVAPGTYLGNRSSYYNGTLRYDIQQSTTGVPNQHAEVTIANSLGITLYYFPATPNQPAAAPAWTTFSVTLNNALGYWKTTNSATGAAATEAQVLNVLTDLSSLQIRGLYRDANTTNRLDNVSMRPPIVITTQPTSSTICNGITTTLTTVATGNPTITYQWQRETTPAVWTNVTNTGGYSGVTTATLSVNTTGNFGAGNYRCQVSGLAVEDAFTSTAIITIIPLPAAPTTTGSSSCTAANITLTAAGGVAGQYRWYTVPSGGIAIAGQTNSTYTTPLLAVTTTYYVAINNGTCESARTAVIATINTPPAAPTTTGSSSCTAASLTLTAAGGAAGQYRWYTVPTGGIAIAGQTNNTYATPVLAITTTYYAAINNGTCESTRTAVIATINTPPAAPTTTGSAACGASTLSLSASGGAAGQYRWYTVSTGGTAIAGQTNSTFNTPLIAITTTYYVAINNGICESTRTAVIATINTPPAAPTTTGSSSCTAASLTLTAAGGAAGQYRWYTVPTGGTALPGQTNSSYTTPVLSSTTTYYVAINDGTCESTRTPVVANVSEPGCGNTPPSIQSVPITTQINGKIALNLVALIADSDNNIDFSSLVIVSPPSSGASASIDNNFNLIIDYTGISFSGTENITIRVCDVFSACVDQTFSIDVIGDIEIFTGMSPNNDGKNDIFLIQYIELLPETQKNKVTIFNRWGSKVFEVSNYNNTTNVFNGLSENGSELPSGTYFYKIEFESGRKSETGYLTLKK